MGMGGNIKNIEHIFQKNKKLFCYCISEYPLKISKINWHDAIKFDGFSDHTTGITAAILFTTLKKLKNSKFVFIEKHVKLKNSKGPDAETSITVNELETLVSHVRIIEKTKII